MPATSVPVETDFQRLVVEHALALAREMETTAGQAPNGQVLGRCEGVLLSRGREFLATVLKQVVQHTADEVVKKGGLLGPARAVSRPVTRDRRRARS